jgi:uncharacterized repeat protein (TIGR01451 family)
MSCLGAFIILMLAVPAAAHPVTIGDTSRSDWFGKGPPADNIGAIVRDTAGRGEFVWSDKRGDQRVVGTSAITRETDLTSFAVTADATNLYFLARVERYSGISNNPPLQLIISIDGGADDPNHTLGRADLPDAVATNVSDAAKWEYAVETQFAPGAPQSFTTSAQPKVFKADSTSVLTGSAQLVSSAARQGGYAEIQIPWAAINGQPLPDNTLRFTVSTYFANHGVPAGDGLVSKAIDVISSDALGTAHELADGKIDTYFELHFNASGDVFAPVLLSEFLPDPPTSGDPKGEWIEIHNPNTFDVGLNGYKVGDQPYRTGSQGMVLLPNRQLAAGATLVLANNKTVFLTRYPTVDPNNVVDMNALTSYTAWASGHITLQNQNGGLAFKESLVLLDPNDTIADMVQYAYKTALGPTGLDPDNKPILLTGPTVAPNASYDRCPSGQDTNDSGLDFFVHTGNVGDLPTPGAACTTVPGVDLRISKDGPEAIEASLGTTFQYLIPFSNAGSTPASNVVITDTLPVGLSCVSQVATVSAGVITPPVNCPSADGATLTWNIASLASSASGTITLTVKFDTTPLQDIQLVNQVGIRSTPTESNATLHNNVASHTVITAGPADLGVTSTWAAQNPSPGREFTYTIAYGNFGEDTAYDIVIADQLPAQATFVGQEAPAGVTFVGAPGNKPSWKISSLAYQEGGTITVVARLADTSKSGAKLAHNLTITSSPADLTQAGEQPDSDQAQLTIGKRMLYLPLVIK